MFQVSCCIQNKNVLSRPWQGPYFISSSHFEDEQVNSAQPLYTQGSVLVTFHYNQDIQCITNFCILTCRVCVYACPTCMDVHMCTFGGLGLMLGVFPNHCPLLYTQVRSGYSCQPASPGIRSLPPAQWDYRHCQDYPVSMWVLGIQILVHTLAQEVLHLHLCPVPSPSIVF